MAATIPGESRRGLAGGPFDFIGTAVQGIASIAGNVPNLAAAFGDKNAKAFASAQESVQCAQAGGNWTGSSCDMSATIRAKADAAAAQARVDTIKAWALPVVGGLGILGLTFAAVKVANARSAA